MGMNVNDIFAQDPELIQRRIAMQEMQQLNPSGTAAGAIGAVLGRGVANLQQDRGFFSIADPALRRASEMQAVFADVMQTFDPNNPAASYEKLSRDLAARGLAQQAATAAQEAARIRQGERAEARAERGLVIQEESAKETRYKNNPELLLKEALELPETDPTRQVLLARYSRIAEDRNYSIAQRNADLEKAKADTERIRALAAKEGEIGVLGKPGPVGKAGGFRDVNGQIYGPAAMQKERDAFKALGTMLEKVNEITASDVRQAESVFDYTQEGGVIKGAAGKFAEKTVGAQTKLAAVQLLQQIDSLPPGSASDADMKAAKAAFPGYGSARNLLNWINDTKRLLERNYNDYAERFGFEKKIKPTGQLTFDKQKSAPADEWAIIDVKR